MNLTKEKFLQELNLLLTLNYMKNPEIKDENIIYVDYVKNKIEIGFILNIKNKERILITKINSSEYEKEKLNKFLTEFINNFEWKQNIRLLDYFEKLDYEIINNFILKQIDEVDNILNGKNIYSLTILINLISILIKLLTGLYEYSGHNDPPKFGDYEAQRHWMEITYNLNTTNWYTDSESNPKEYWPLDYPPLSGYYSYLWGYIFNIILPESIMLKSSWGFESIFHKFLMRFSVIISDFIFFHIPVMILSKFLYLSKNKEKYLQFYISLFLLLCHPILIIIDHGHFQYNCVMHGLFIFSIYFLYKKYFILSVFAFCLCINFKQMGLYYALPLPFYVIKHFIDEIKIKNYDKFYALLYLFTNILKYAIYTILFMALIWGPWIINNNYLDVVTRIFPIWRGVFEDKVASFWCNLNIVYKINKIPHYLMILISLIFTVIPSLSSCLAILFYNKTSKKITNLAFFINSLSFFFFSFHVHEKTILVPFLAYLFCLFDLYKILPSFSLVALFSLHPLLKREGQLIPYFTLIIMQFVFCNYIKNLIIERKIVKSENIKYNNKYNSNGNNLSILYNHNQPNGIEIHHRNNSSQIIEDYVIPILDKFNFVFIIIYHILEYKVATPKSYPWLYPTINAAFSFGNFFIFYVYAQMKLYSKIY